MERDPDGSSGLRIGLFGGTFDPPHVGHVAVATDVADALGLERVLWIPAGEPPHKPARSVSDAHVRLAMARGAAEGDPRFEVDALELDRAGPSYTVDTVRALRSTLPDAELFLILGVDEFKVFDRWRQPERIVEQVRLAVMDREGESAAASASALRGVEETLFVAVRRVDLSSTEVRTRVREGGDIRRMVPDAVRTIIERERLYSAP